MRWASLVVHLLAVVARIEARRFGEVVALARVLEVVARAVVRAVVLEAVLVLRLALAEDGRSASQAPRVATTQGGGNGPTRRPPRRRLQRHRTSRRAPRARP